MKNNKYINIGITVLLVYCGTLLSSCERDLSDDVTLVTYPTTAEVFTDNFISMGSDFYFPYQGAKPDVFSVDNNEGYDSEASIRIDVPNADDPSGNFAGAIFRVDGVGRDLSGYDALTFWAKSTQAVTINEFGFGQNFNGDELRVVMAKVNLTTNWKQYTIPIPDPSLLTEERGLFQFAAGGIGPEGEEVGYSFWVDEIKFEKLGTVAQPRPSILNGIDRSEQTFIGIEYPITDLTQTYNLANGSNVTTIVTPGYYSFYSSNRSVVSVSDLGVAAVIGVGTAKITAVIRGVQAKGSLTIESLGNFQTAPDPTVDPANVISIFSDVYENRPVDFYNGYYEPFQTTTSADFVVNGNHVLNYQNYNFVGIEFNQNVPTIDASGMTHLHFDMYIPDNVPSGSNIRINLVDFGANKTFAGGDDTSISRVLRSELVQGSWISIDFAISGLANRNNLGQIVFDAEGNFDPRPSSFYLDNIYFYN